MNEGLQRALEILQQDIKEHEYYVGTVRHEGMLRAIELIEKELELELEKSEE